MGRKSAKAKEKKLRRKEENARIATSLGKIEAANKLDDPLDMLPPFKVYNRNGNLTNRIATSVELNCSYLPLSVSQAIIDSEIVARAMNNCPVLKGLLYQKQYLATKMTNDGVVHTNLNLSIECKKVSDLSDETIEWAFQLTKVNMQKFYEASEWGWKDREKKDEMTEDKAWYLIAQDREKPVGMVHFRFDMEGEEEVLYCYEIQLISDVRRKGLGKFMMQILELLAHKTEMKKVMLTTFKHNVVGHEFFTHNMRYELDEISPEEPLFEEGFSYVILSKKIAPKKPSSHSENRLTEHAACCAHHHQHD